MAFWITSRMKATKEQVDDKLMVIKLFTSNYARDLICSLHLQLTYADNGRMLTLDIYDGCI
jgi:hypothetical protein